MDKKSKAVKYLLISCLILTLYILLSSDLIKLRESKTATADNKNKKENIVDQKIMSDKYKQETKLLYKKYKTILSSIITLKSSSFPSGEDAEKPTNSTNNLQTEMSSIKIQLLDLTAPPELRELHLELFRAFSKMENYLKNDSIKDRNDSNALTLKIEKNYSWITEQNK